MWKMFFIFVLFISFSSYGQNINVVGKVIDNEDGHAVSFCNIYDLNQQFGVQSNDKGEFELSSIPSGTFLIFQAIGYINDTVEVKNNKDYYRIFLKQEKINLAEIVVTGVTRRTSIRENPVPITPISREQLEETSESNIIDILVKNSPGLTSVKTGPNISKPFIHGLGYNRVLTIYDGVRQEGHQFGDEHGIEVDNYNIEKAEVVKGPSSLLYGSDALAGVITLIPHIPTNRDSKLRGDVFNEYHTNNNLIGNALRLYYSDEMLQFALRGSFRKAKNYRNPSDGRVYMSNFEEKNLSFLTGLTSDRGYTQFNITYYNNLQGIPDGSRDSITRKFTKQIYDDEDDLFNRPIVSNRELNSYRIPVIHQDISHYRVYLKGFYEIGSGDVSYLFSGQQNVRKEFASPLFPNIESMYMRLNTINYSFNYNLPQFNNFETSVGFNGIIQNNKHIGASDFPIPNYDMYDIGFYLYEKWKMGKWSVSGGVRGDFRDIKWADFYVGENPTTGFDMHVVGVDTIGAELQFPEFNKKFKGVSGSIGATYQINRKFTLKGNIGRAYRAPNVTELGSNGLDPGAHIIYLGDKTFNPEFSFQKDLGVSFKYENFSGEFSFFHNDLDNYIYLTMVVDDNGIPISDNQGNKTYQYMQSKAELYGAETKFSIHPTSIKGLKWDNLATVVYGFNRDKDFAGTKSEGEYLPMIPPLAIISTLSYNIPEMSKRITNVTPKLEVEYFSKQNRFYGLNETETATDGYMLLNIGINGTYKYTKRHNVKWVFQVNNILNETYQSHLNRLKYFEYYDRANTETSGIYDMGINFIGKLIWSF